MPREVLTAPRAAQTLAEALAWFSQQGAGSRARKIHDRLEAAAAYLQEFPLAGHESPDHEGYYQLVVADHRFLYTIRPRSDSEDVDTPGDVEIVAIFRPGQP